MNQYEIKGIQQNAKMIVGGYAFCIMDNDNIRIIDLHKPNHACIIDHNGLLLETNMDDIEIALITDLWNKNQKYILEKKYAEIL